MTNADNIYLASGSTHRTLAEEVSQQMGLDLHDDEIKIFPSGERYFRFSDSVRNKHTVLIQSVSKSESGSINDSLIELVLMIDAARRGSAKEITVVMPFLAYTRQDRKSKGREPISAAAIINLLQATGANRLVSVDMHSSQTQAVFDGPFDHLIAEYLLEDALKGRIGQANDKFVVVSPDGGRAKIAELYAESLNVDLVHVPKSRSRQDSSQISRPEAIDGVNGKNCILIDDMIDTAGTLTSAAQTLSNSGASSIITAATHALLSDPAIKRLKDSPITEILVTDTIPVAHHKAELGDKLSIVPVAPMLAAALTEIINGGSITAIFKGKNYL